MSIYLLLKQLRAETNHVLFFLTDEKREVIEDKVAQYLVCEEPLRNIDREYCNSIVRRLKDSLNGVGYKYVLSYV